MVTPFIAKSGKLREVNKMARLPEARKVLDELIKYQEDYDKQMKSFGVLKESDSSYVLIQIRKIKELLTF